MNSQHLKKTLQLIRRTGDKGIIIDEESDELFVLMNVEAYEKMLPPVEEMLTNPPLPRPSGELPRQDLTRLEESLDDFVPDDFAEVEEPRRVAPSIPAAPISFAKAVEPVAFEFKQHSVNREESLADVPHDGEEEEKFYLEPVE